MMCNYILIYILYLYYYHCYVHLVKGLLPFFIYSLINVYCYLGVLWWTSFQLISSCICHPDALIPSSPSLLSSVLISLFLLSPSLLFKMAKFQAIASNPIVLLVVRLLSVLPMIVCQFPGPGNRLAAMCVGGVGCVMAIVGGWCNTSCIDR